MRKELPKESIALLRELLLLQWSGKPTCKEWRVVVVGRAWLGHATKMSAEAGDGLQGDSGVLQCAVPKARKRTMHSGSLRKGLSMAGIKGYFLAWLHGRQKGSNSEPASGVVVQYSQKLQLRTPCSSPLLRNRFIESMLTPTLGMYYYGWKSLHKSIRRGEGRRMIWGVCSANSDMESLTRCWSPPPRGT